MKEKNENEYEFEIDIRRIFKSLFKNSVLIALVTIICGTFSLVYTCFFVTPLYKASTMVYVNNNSVSIGDSISSSDITASKSLVNSYIVILKTSSTLNDVIEYSGLDYSYGEVKSMISAAPVNSTEIFEIVVTNSNPSDAKKIADAIGVIFPKKIASVIEGSSAKIVAEAVKPTSPSSPSYSKNTITGLIFGFIISAGLIALREILDVTVRTEDDIKQSCSYPLLAVIPNLFANESDNKTKYKFTLRKILNKKLGKQVNKVKKINTTKSTRKPLLGNEVSFAAKEAYNLLRTKIQYSFADDKKCYVIGVSSALAGEGKSTTCCNIACSLAQLNKKVLIIDCDMRKPTVHLKLGARKSPGLSNYLTRHSQLSDVVFKYIDESMMYPFDTILAGQTPPNPVELLSSQRMMAAIEELREEYDYILLDLPPIGEVSDPLVAARLTDGIVVVSRQDHCTRPALSEAIKQFEFVGSKILGVVFNYANESKGAYGYKYGYKYANRYGK